MTVSESAPMMADRSEAVLFHRALSVAVTCTAVSLTCDDSVEAEAVSDSSTDTLVDSDEIDAPLAFIRSSSFLPDLPDTAHWSCVAGS